MRAFQDAWEGQPDLTLPAFIGMLQLRGLSWGSTEEELLMLLDALSSHHPALITAPPMSPTLITTSAPRMSITLTGDGNTVIVRSGDDPRRMPGLWTYTELRPAGPGRPLVITDGEGVEHRLGIVELISALDPTKAPSLNPLEQSEVGSARWLIVFADGSRGVLGQRLRVWTTVGRETNLETIAWRSVQVAPGEDMKVAPAGGGNARQLGPVAAVWLLEV